MSLPVALDTNVLVRLLVNDDPAQAEQAAALGVAPAGDGFCRAISATAARKGEAACSAGVALLDFQGPADLTAWLAASS